MKSTSKQSCLLLKKSPGQPVAVLLMGLPLSGKSTWVNDNLDKLENPVVVSADAIKESHPDYDPEHSYRLHQYSVKEAERVLGGLVDKGENFVLDGGGINNSYTKRIVDKIRNAGKQNTLPYHVVLVHVKTPLFLCLERTTLRSRKVPAEEIIAKACKEPAAFKKIRQMVDQVIVVPHFSNKNIFVDMDGVMAAQTTLPRINGEIDFVNSEIFLYQEPVLPVIDKLKILQDKGHVIRVLSAVPTSISLEEKHAWLDQYAPFIPKGNRFFVNQGRHKAEMLEGLRRRFKLEKKDVTLVDDYHDTLYSVLERHMNPMHVSEFISHEF